MQARRIAEWVELGFWQAAVRLLSRARPLRPLVSKAAKALDEQNLARRLPWKPILAASGWLCGLLIGYLVAVWWL